MRLSKRLGLLVVFGVLVVWTAQGFSFGTASGCRTCHPGFTVDGPGTGPGPLHSLHVGSGQMTSNCQLCHMSGSFGVPDINESGEAGGVSCTGCHIPQGLWQRHQASSVSCLPCHDGWPTPAPESTLPPYYSRGDVALTNPCAINPAEGGEDYDGDNQGLDNDGDTFYETADSDCTSPIEAQTWATIKSLYGV